MCRASIASEMHEAIRPLILDVSAKHEGADIERVVMVRSDTGDEVRLWPSPECLLLVDGRCKFPQRLNRSAIRTIPARRWVCDPQLRTKGLMGRVHFTFPSQRLEPVTWQFRLNDTLICGLPDRLSQSGPPGVATVRWLAVLIVAVVVAVASVLILKGGAVGADTDPVVPPGAQPTQNGYNGHDLQFDSPDKHGPVAGGDTDFGVHPDIRPIQDWCNERDLQFEWLDTHTPGTRRRKKSF